jgi:hypothetical protein
MGKGKTGQNRKTVISTTAQWRMEKKDKMTNRDQQYSTMAKGKKGQNAFGHCAVLLITVCLFCPYFSLPIVLYC